MSKHVYLHISDFDMGQVLQKLSSGDDNLICEAILCTTLYSEDYDFTTNVILNHIYNDNMHIKSYAIIALGHLARIYNELPNNIPVIRIIEEALNNRVLQSIAEDAAEHIHRLI